MQRLLIALLLTAVCAAPAHAAPPVAIQGPFSLFAHEAPHQVCLTLTRNGAEKGYRCGRRPLSAQRPMQLRATGAVNTYAASVPPIVRSVETEAEDGTRSRRGTFSGNGSTLRYVLVPGAGEVRFVRFFNAARELVGIDAGPAGYITPENQTPLFGAPDDGVAAFTELQIAPTPAEPDRVRTVGCVSLIHAGRGNAFCNRRADDGLVIQGACESGPLIGGIVSEDITEVRLTLGNGAVTSLPATELPEAFGAVRAIAGATPSDQAIRAAEAIDTDGETVTQMAIGMPPGGQGCGASGQGDDGVVGPLVPVATPEGVSVAIAAGRELLIADQGERLCVGFNELEAGVCPPPPIDADHPRLKRRGKVVGAAVTADAATVTLDLDRGRDVTVPTIDGPEYEGQWAGQLRFFAARVGKAEVVGATVRDEDGTIIGESEQGIADRSVAHVEIEGGGGLGIELLRRPGKDPCVTAFADEPVPAPQFCFAHTPPTIDGAYYPYEAAITVACSPRAAIAYGRMPNGFDPPEVVLEGADPVPANRIGLRGNDAWLAYVPEATIIGLQAGPRNVGLRLPPPAEQCGYSLARVF